MPKIPVPELTEKALEDFLIELQAKACNNIIGLRPSAVVVPDDIVREVARRLGVTVDEAFKHIQRISIMEITRKDSSNT